ncbi:MAG: hypothetical protein H7Z40_23665 [Phycisphaerae bacterium]|nr:hypothetical protein [Gemmatimonadaceae bacterium]
MTGMLIEYLDRPTRRWVTAAQAASLQPRALRLTLTAADGVIAPTLLSLPMIVTITQAQVNAAPRTPTR